MLRFALGFINKIFGHPLASVIIISIAWLNKLFINISFYSLSDDKPLYSLLALNATEGHVFTELVAENRPFSYVAYLYGNKVYCNTPALAISPDLIQPNTVLLIAIQEEDLSVIKNYINNPDVRSAGRRGGFYLFIQEKK